MLSCARSFCLLMAFLPGSWSDEGHEGHQALRLLTCAELLLGDFKGDQSEYIIGRAIYFEVFLIFFCGRFCFFLGSWFYAFLLLCFSAVLLPLLFCFFPSLLFCFSCFSACLLLCFSASLLFCFSAFLLLLFAFPAFCFPASLLFHASLLYLLLFFSASLLSLLLCFFVFVLLCLSTSTIYSTFSFLQSCVFAALLPAPLLLSFLSLLPLCFFFSFALFSTVCILNETLKTLGETEGTLKKILIRTPDKKPIHETLNEP